MVSPRWVALAGLLVGSACGDLPEPFWELEEPRVIGLRTEVVETGRFSAGLLPIPADRARSDALPGDVVVFDVLIASEEGILDPAELELQWFLCSADQRCLSLLREPGQGLPCEVMPVESICRAGQGARPRIEIPALDPSHSFAEQLALRVAMVAGLPGGLPTASCLELLTDEPYERLSGCLFAYGTLTLGPPIGLRRAAEVTGLTVNFDDSELPPEIEALAAVPNFNPEVERMVLTPVEGGPEVLAFPGQVNRIPAGRSYSISELDDRRDRQRYAVITGDDVQSFGLRTELFQLLTVTTKPGWLDYMGMTTGSVGETTDVIAIITDSRTSQGWAIFEFEAVED